MTGPTSYHYDVVVVGAGVAGAAAASDLARAGFRVAIVDPRVPVPHTFGAEIMGADHVARLRALDLLEPVRAAATRIHRVAEACRGVCIKRFDAEHYSLSCDRLVDTIRRTIGHGAELTVARVRGVEAGPGRSRVHLDDGRCLVARLVVVATGPSGSMMRMLGITKRIVSRNHSVTFGAAIAPEPGRVLDFDELTYWGDDDAARVMLATFFPLADGMRLNMVAHWPAADRRIAAFRTDPDRTMADLLPRLHRVIGRVSVHGPIDIHPVHLHELEGHVQPGLVLIGDAYSVSCPGVGTGVAKALNDVEILCRTYVPRWLEEPETSADEIARFYGDPRKEAFDRRTAEMNRNTRSTACDDDPHWRLRRGARALRRRVIAALHRRPGRIGPKQGARGVSAPSAPDTNNRTSAPAASD